MMHENTPMRLSYDWLHGRMETGLAWTRWPCMNSRTSDATRRALIDSLHVDHRVATSRVARRIRLV